MTILFELIVFYFFLFFNCLKSEPSAWDLLSESLNEKLAIGALPNLHLKHASFYVNNLRYRTRFNSLSSSMRSMQADGNIISGNGIAFKPSDSRVVIDVILPQNKSNVCGLIFGSGQNSNDFIQNVKILYKSSLNKWYSVADPTTGDFIFNLDFQTDSEYKVILIDPVPTDEIRILIPSIKGSGSSIQLAVIHGCTFSPTIKIDNCIEKFQNNEKFKGLSSEGPFSISCPTECKKTQKCFGVNIYSEDSPICLAAYERFGNCGDGNYFLYSIPKVSFFHSNLNPRLNNGVLCQKSTLSGPGITFNRKYYDDGSKVHEKR